MKRILAIITLGAAVAAALTGCGNKSPYERLAASVDSINTVMQQQPVDYAESTSVKYDELTNTVQYDLVLPGKVDTAQMSAGGSQIEQAFLIVNVLGNPDFGEKIVDAEANISVTFQGKEGGKFEYMIESKKIADVFHSVFTDKRIKE